MLLRVCRGIRLFDGLGVIGVWVGSLLLVGCGPIGGMNYNWQKPGGDTQNPTDITETPGRTNAPSDGKSNIPGVASHARLATTKDGRFVLFTPSEREGVQYYQPAKDNAFWKNLEEVSQCNLLKNAKMTKPFQYTLLVLDLKEDKVYKRVVSTHFPRLSVILHPNSSSFFVPDYRCNPTMDTKAMVLIHGIQQIALPSLKTIQTFEAVRDTQRAFSKAHVQAWYALPYASSDAKSISIPWGQTRFSLSPKAGYLGLYRHAKGDQAGHDLYMIDLSKLSFRRVTLGSPMIHMHYTKSEDALYAVASKEFDTYEVEKKHQCWKDDNRTKKAECRNLKAWMDVVRISLKPTYRLDTLALALGYSVDNYARIEESAHGQAAMTPTMTISPDKKRLVLSMCDKVNWKQRACSGQLYLLDANTLTLERKIPGLGPAAFSPDGSTLVAWDGKRNEYEQVVVPLFKDESDDYSHWLVLINTKTWKRHPVRTPFFGPLYFITPKGNFVVTVSDLGGNRMLITDLDSGRTVNIAGNIQMAEFSVSNDGSVIYSVERGGVVKINLKLGTQTHLIPEGNFVENVMVLPKHASFAHNVKPSQRPFRDTRNLLKEIRVKLAGTSLQATVLIPRSIPAAVATSKDGILVSRHARKVFEVRSDSSQLLYKKDLR